MTRTTEPHDVLLVVVVSPAGTAACLYGEAIDLSSLGELEITRASHVEPDGRGRWWADLSPAGGPRLGPFDRRSSALAAEARWLNTRLLGGHTPPHEQDQQDPRHQQPEDPS